MKIEVANHSGFCFGVKRAIKIVEQTLKKEKNIYCMGPIIHNPQVVKNLTARGLKIVKDISIIKEGILVIPAHGLEPALIEEAYKKDLKIIDATCPLVKKAQKYAEQLKKDKYHIVIIGDKNHAETKGIVGFCGTNFQVVENKAEIDIKRLEREKKIGIVSQTTQGIWNLREISLAMLPYSNELRIYNTICETTIRKQNAAKKLAKRSDIMIVIGGYNSANTKRLVEVSKETGVKTYHIETAQDINFIWLKDKEKIGISAGASTSPEIIKNVVSKIRDMHG
ncbi:MAG: 4-hydroxy-3-methylbut-2-enyl diphosphate reductase [bacterium]|nr:4-hydroxy-3-methylbut-2-enyl diphosphate reductase [bacterium]